MSTLRLKNLGADKDNSGYTLFEDETGKTYSAFSKSGNDVMMRTFATLNEFGERDMPVFTKEYCEYEGIERDEYVVIDIVVNIQLSLEEAESITKIIEAILYNLEYMRGSILKTSSVYNLNSEDILSMKKLLSFLK